DRARAVAEMTKSLAPLAFAEVLFFAVRITAMLVVTKWYLDFLSRREAKRIVERMRKEGRG
ncbi:MAG TPA: hypothetical protein VH593_32950, partial [Ktedonobacteraceae bacterium]